MEDITPKLFRDIESDFKRELKNSKKLQRIIDKIENGTATYADADDYAVEAGELLSKAYKRHLSPELLPDGKMYYNIADRIIYGMLEGLYNLVSGIAGEIQEGLNRKAVIGIKAIKAPVNRERIMGLVNAVSASGCFDDVAYLLGEPIVNYAQSIVTDSIKENVEFHGQAGLKPTIKRIPQGGCCSWCAGLAGTYRYPKVPKDVYRRHRYCRCIVVYDPGDGKLENVHTKKELMWEESAALESRKRSGDFKYQKVTAQYFGTATPGRGNITYQEGYDRKKHASEIKMAQLLHDKFGGNIELLDEAKESGIKTPDFLWREKYWELKTVTTEKAADTAIRKGLKQIEKNPGGLILDYRDKKISLESLEQIVDGRMRRGFSRDTDIMVILNKNEIKVYRYKK